MQVPTGETLPSFLGAVDQMGYSLVHGTWVDRVAESGGMEAVPSAAGVTRAEDSSARNTDDGEETQRGSGVSMDRAFPLQCVIGSCVDPHHVGFASGWERGGGGGFVWRYRFFWRLVKKERQSPRAARVAPLQHSGRCGGRREAGFRAPSAVRHS